MFGSAARGEVRAHSDLDILIIEPPEDGEAPEFYRRSFRDFGWFIEVFAGSPAFNKRKLENAAKGRGSSFLQMCAESIILKDTEHLAAELKKKAIVIRQSGAPPLTFEETLQYRYIITDWLDNLADSDGDDESLFIVYDLTAKAAELLLASHRHRIGEQKWLFRALKQLDHPLGRQLIENLKQFYETGEKRALINTIEQILEPVGGRLYEGFSSEG